MYAVSACNACGCSALSAEDWGYASYEPIIPSNPSPPDGATGQPVDVNLSWSGGHPCGAQGLIYGVTYWVNGYSVELGSVSTNDRWVEPGELDPKTRYYWMVGSSLPSGSTGVSGPIWTFTTGDSSQCPVPDPPVNVQASDGTIPCAVSITWDSVPTATYYEVHHIDAGIAPSFIATATTTNYEDSWNNWRSREYTIKACNACGCSGCGDIDFGRAFFEPDMPSDPSPAVGATNQPVDVALRWGGGHPCGDDNSFQDVYMWTDELPKTQVCHWVTRYCEPGILQHGTRYYWQVLNSLAMEVMVVEGPVWEFTTAEQQTTGPSR